MASEASLRVSPRLCSIAHRTMSLFIPRSQLRDMLDAEVSKALCAGPSSNNANLGKIVALQALMHQPQPTDRLHVNDNWLDDNWLDDGF